VHTHTHTRLCPNLPTYTQSKDLLDHKEGEHMFLSEQDQVHFMQLTAQRAKESETQLPAVLRQVRACVCGGVGARLKESEMHLPAVLRQVRTCGCECGCMHACVYMRVRTTSQSCAKACTYPLFCTCSHDMSARSSGRQAWVQVVWYRLCMACMAFICF